LVNNIDIPDDVTIALIQAIYRRNGVPFFRLQSHKIARAENKILSEEAFTNTSEVSLDEMKQMHAFITPRGGIMHFTDLILPRNST
jgi:hypothetical protein